MKRIATHRRHSGPLSPAAGERARVRGRTVTRLNSLKGLDFKAKTYINIRGRREALAPSPLPLSPGAGARGPNQANRRGGAMVFVLLLLLLISMMGTSLVRGAITQHRQRRHDEIRAQTVRLAEAGWNRALRNLGQSPDYTGEIWQIGDEVLGPERRANVRIEIVSENARRTLRVIAEYPVENPMITRFTLEGTLSPDKP